MNLKNSEFTFNDKICKFFNDKYELDYPIISNKYSIKDDEIKWYDQNIKDLNIKIID